MEPLVLPNRILSLSDTAADRLIAAGNGDAALLYLALLRHGESAAARQRLGWSDTRCAAALEQLVKLGLAQGNVEQAAAPELSDEPPDYQRSDLTHALEHDGTFAALHQAVETALGKPLSEADLKSLYTVYDYLSFPPELVYTLVGWCVAEAERKYGPGRRPRMPTVKKEAFRWKRLGVDTPAAAEEFLRAQQSLRGREADLLPLLDIRDRAAVGREREYIAGWVDMGFENDAIRLAYERTVLQKGSMNWAYMNGILKRWHAAGLHTAAQAEAGDKPATPGRSGARTAGIPRDVQPTPERAKKNADWLDEFLAGEEQKGT